MNQPINEQAGRLGRQCGMPYDDTTRMIVSDGLREDISVEDQIELFDKS